MLIVEGILRRIVGTELIECDEIVESDYPGFLTDVDLSYYFGEEFLRDVSEKKLNPNRKTHREFFLRHVRYF